MSRESRLRNGSYEYGQINVNSAGVDDLLTRGNGAVKLPPNFNSYFEYERPRKGNWAYNIEAEAFSGGLSGNDKVGYSIDVEPTYFISDAFNVYVGVCRQPHAGLAGLAARQSHRQFRWARSGPQCRLQLDHHEPPGTAVEAAGHRLECRLAPGLSRRCRRQCRTTRDEPVDDFSVRKLGFQIRYRYELAPLSYLYVVYGRGGYEQDGRRRLGPAAPR